MCFRWGATGDLKIWCDANDPHEFDECRFDVGVNDCVWYLRAETPDDRHKWVEALEACKAESGYGSENNLRRHGSAISIASATLSGASTSSFKKGRGLREKLAEMETFRDILCRQVDTLQSYFDACSESVAAMNQTLIAPVDLDGDGDDMESNRSNSTSCSDFESHKLNQAVRSGILSKELLIQHGNHSLDFKGETLTFKATTAGILTTLSHCIELMTQREDSWRRRLDKEVERRKKIEELYRQAHVEAQQKRTVILGGPDYEEGPHSILHEEEFFDAVDASLDKLDSEEERRLCRTKLKANDRQQQISKLTQHAIWPDVERITREQLNYARMGVGEGGWFLFAEEGEMKMYKREVEEGGVVVDPLKAVHTVKGVTGHEMCHYFFDPDVRLDWESTVETMKVVEMISEDCLVFHQVHKRVWPAAVRDSLFWSHIRCVRDVQDEDAHGVWIVCNNSTDHVEIPLGKFVRVKLTICLVCQTFIDPPADNAEIQRDNVTCKITYCATVNPGGWAPSSVLRAVYKREYPKFLKRFTQYVRDQTENKAILF